MTEVGREEQLILCLTRNDQFAIGQATRFQGTVDTDLIGLISQLLFLSLRHTESPALLIIRGHIGNPVRLVWLCIDMLQQFLTTHRLMDGQGIAQHMQVAVAKVHDCLTFHRTNPSSTDVPLLRNRPVEDLCARRHLKDLYFRYGLTNHVQ